MTRDDLTATAVFLALLAGILAVTVGDVAVSAWVARVLLP